MRLKTDYVIEEIPHAEYPRPQFVRDGYLCLNGKWRFTVKKAGEKFDKYDREIIVPFSPETLNSGIEEGFTITASDRLYYEKTFELSEEWCEKNTVLHFGAVDMDMLIAKAANRGPDWINHLRRRGNGTINNITHRTPRGEIWLKIARILQTIFRPIYAIDKPGMLGLKRVVKLPGRFQNSGI